MNTIDTTPNPHEPFTAPWRAYEMGANPHNYVGVMAGNPFRGDLAAEIAKRDVFALLDVSMLADAFDEGAALRRQNETMEAAP